MTEDIERLAALRVAETGLTPAELLALPMDEYARVTGRLTPTEAALQAINAERAQAPQAPPQAPDSAFTQTVETPQGIDPDSDEYFLAWRQERMRNSGSGEGIGVFSGTGSRSEAYRDAARKHAGRTALGNAHVVESPRLTNRYIRQDDQLDHRSAVERLSNAATLWQGR